MTGFHFTDAVSNKERDTINVDVGNKNINKNNNNETKLKILNITITNACNKALNTLEQFINYKFLLKPGEPAYVVEDSICFFI